MINSIITISLKDKIHECVLDYLSFMFFHQRNSLFFLLGSYFFNQIKQYYIKGCANDVIKHGIFAAYAIKV